MDIDSETVVTSFHNDEEVKAAEATELDRIRRALKAKDDGDVSDAAYHELKQVPGSNLPSLNKVMKERKEQNKIIDMDFDKGCVRTIKDIIGYLMQDKEFQQSIERETRDSSLTLRFSGDGRRTTKKLGSVMTTFCVPSESCEKRSPDKEYCIAVYDGKEDYDLLSHYMGAVFDEMETLQEHGLDLNGTHCRINWLMCADWKFMAILMGINPPCSDHFCLWCKCCKKQITDFSISDWPISRTYNECCKLADVEGKSFGVRYPPLVHIEFDHLIPDTLHLELRIRGKLLNQVACWAMEQKKKSEMEKAMEDIGIKFAFTDVQDDSGKTVTKWTSFDCDDLETIIKKLDLKSFLSNMSDKSRTSLDCLSKQQLVTVCRKYGLAVSGTKEVLRTTLKQYLEKNNIQFQMSSVQSCDKKMLDVQELAELWRGFEVLADALKADALEPSYLSPKNFKSKALQWANNFRRATFDEDVIPYIHVLVYHVPQFLEIFTTIHRINCQTVEKKNHLQNRTFHRGSQKGGLNSNYTLQVMARENRKLFARVNNIQRQKRTYTKRKSPDSQ